MEYARGDGKNSVAEALWRVVARDGMTRVSVRTVATEAGVTGGTVQHYFPTRAQMIHYAMDLLATQFTQRLTDMPRTGPTHDWTRAIMLALLPLTAERQREFRVWLAFTTHADTDRTLMDLKHRFSESLREMYVRLVRARKPTLLNTSTVPHQDSDETDDIEAAVLQSIIDGLGLNLADLDPDDAATRGARLLDHYLAMSDSGID